jgi:hypothetical protein
MTVVSQGLAWRRRRRLSSQVEQLLGDESEAKFMRDVLDELAWFGWTLRYHAWDSTKSAAGFPDIIAIRGDRGLALECKSQHDRTSRERRQKQQDWVDGFNRIPGFIGRIVRPSDWPWILQVIR